MDFLCYKFRKSKRALPKKIKIILSAAMMKLLLLTNLLVEQWLEGVGVMVYIRL